MSTTTAPTDPWSTVVGQDRAVAELRAATAAPVHAYLLVGPRGSGKRALAGAFAAALLSEGRQDAARDVELALAEEHPDLTVVERTGAFVAIDQARQIVERASRAPVEGSRKVLVLDEFHLVRFDAAGVLLKTIEEPPEGTFFVVLADEITPDLVTIASRCVRVELGPIPAHVMIDRLVAEGVERDRAQTAAEAAAGDLGRARVLATDDRLELRRRSWTELPGRLDGTGATAVVAVDELLAMIDDSLESLNARHEVELAELEERVEQFGERGAGRKELVERQRREQRRYRTDEIRYGLAVLSRRYSEQLARSARPAQVIEALDAIQELAEELIRNPNERLQLQALALRLGEAGG